MLAQPHMGLPRERKGKPETRACDSGPALLLEEKGTESPAPEERLCPFILKLVENQTAPTPSCRCGQAAGLREAIQAATVFKERDLALPHLLLHE